MPPPSPAPASPTATCCTSATHLRLYFAPETLLHQSAEYFTAAAIFGGLVALALARRPATGPVYASWRVLHPALLEVALLFGTGTVAHHVQAAWLGLVWVSFALITCVLTTRLPLRFQRLGVYGRLYFWLAALFACATSAPSSSWARSGGW